MFKTAFKVHKTNTALLLKISRPHGQEPENVEVEEFGYSAERRYSNIMSGELSDDEKDKFHLFKKFKLMLYDVRNLYILNNDCFYRCLTVCRCLKFVRLLFRAVKTIKLTQIILMILQSTQSQS